MTQTQAKTKQKQITNVDNTLVLLIKNNPSQIDTKGKEWLYAKVILEFDFPITHLELISTKCNLPLATIPYNKDANEFFLKLNSEEELVECIKYDIGVILTLQRQLRYTKLSNNKSLRIINNKLNLLIEELTRKALIDNDKGFNDTIVIEETNESTDNFIIQGNSFINKIKDTLVQNKPLIDVIYDLKDLGIQRFYQLW